MADPTLEERLAKGAGVIGRLFRSGSFCQSGWGANCTCPKPSDFCQAKLKWLSLALGDKTRDVPHDDSPFFMLELMKCSEADALGLAVTMNFEGIGAVVVGSGGQIPWREIARYANDERKEDGRAVLMVLAKFPKSCIIPSKEVERGESRQGAPGAAGANPTSG